MNPRTDTSNPCATPAAPLLSPPCVRLGKAELPWIFGYYLAAGWSVGSLLTYALSLLFRSYGTPVNLQNAFDDPVLVAFLSGQDDLEGFICYTVCFSISLVLAVRRMWRCRESLRQPWPDGKQVLTAFGRTLFVFAPLWAFGLYVFENTSLPRHLPGDSAWPEIAVFTALAAAHWVSIRNLYAESRDAPAR